MHSQGHAPVLRCASLNAPRDSWPRPARRKDVVRAREGCEEMQLGAWLRPKLCCVSYSPAHPPAPAPPPPPGVAAMPPDVPAGLASVKPCEALDMRLRRAANEVERRGALCVPLVCAPVPAPAVPPAVLRLYVWPALSSPWLRSDATEASQAGALGHQPAVARRPVRHKEARPRAWRSLFGGGFGWRRMAWRMAAQTPTGSSPEVEHLDRVQHSLEAVQTQGRSQALGRHV